jgi:DNA-binding transcriptional regulator YiaG
MPNVAIALKAEFARLARKEIRSTLDPLKKATAGFRSEIASLKRRLGQLDKQVKRAARAALTAERIRAQATQNEQEGKHRWRAAGFAQHRQRLGLSAAQCGKLLGVSSLTVYKWESGSVRPRASHLPAIAQLRAMGKREAAAKLEELGS